MTFSLTAVTATLLLSLTCFAQTGANTTPGAQDTPSFRTTTQLVIEAVTVKDKAGQPVTGLTAKDFLLTEDGVPQDIRFFEFQKLDEPPPAAEVAGFALPESQRVPPFARLTRTQISPEPPGDVRYRNRRLLAIYFDLSAMPVHDQIRAFNAAKNFVRTQMTPADLVALMAYTSGAVQVLQDFTADRARLLGIIETLIVGEDENAPPDSADPSRPDTGAAFGQNDAEFNIFFTDRQLAALQTAANMLGRLNEKKSLVYFASGLRLNGMNNQAQLQATINAAIRSGVSFWPIDARGLVAQAPLGDATRGSPGGLAMYTGGAATAALNNYQRSQDTLWTLAADTGGKALLDTNELSRGIVQAQQATGSYYILGYYTTNPNLDGKFRRIKITLREGLQAALDYRQGYYAGKQFAKFTTADRERQLEDALMLGDPITELTIAMENGYFQLNRAEYFVPLMVKIPGSELALARKSGHEYTRIDFIGEIKDEFGATVTNVRDKVDIRLSGATAAELANRPIEYDTGFTLLPGSYRIKFLARDAETGRIGTYEMPFRVPNLNKETQRIPISSVILSSQRAEMKEALFTAVKGTKGQQAQSASPLVEDGRKLIPSVTRVFSRSKEMYVYLQAYQPGPTPPGANATPTPARPVHAYVTLYRDGKKALETKPLSTAELTAARLNTVPLRFSVPLEPLDPGEYLCQVTVVDPATKKAAFWQTPVMVIP
ncbi:MAG: VWA domain-containing protein [Bryobacterales bacterium]|nr:VWA domain-containing protein [Bryobacterales bacterium]